ncbi:MAG: hypothetical protein HZA49_10820 [Planctomycetes bacterium]|nr:hypothetical protein [Planctomycetota bacterium]
MKFFITLFLCLSLSGCTSTLVGGGIPTIIVPYMAAAIDGRLDSSSSKEGIFLKVTSTNTKGWDTTSFKFYDSATSQKINYGEGQKEDYEIGFINSKMYDGWSFAFSKGQYDATVNGIKDRLTERQYYINHTYLFKEELYGIQPFIKAGFGIMHQDFNNLDLGRTDYPGSNAGALLNGALGLRISVYKEIFLSIGGQWERFAVGEGDPTGWWERNDDVTHRFNSFISISGGL